MGIPQTPRRRNRLRTKHRHQHPPLISSETTPRTRRPRSCRSHTIQTQDRHRNHGYRLATITCLILLGTLGTMTPTAHATTVGRCPQFEQQFKKYGLPPKTFSRLAWRESRCNPKSISAVRQSTGHPDVGLVQIQGSWSSLTQRTCRVKRTQVVKALTTLDCQLKVVAVLWNHGKGASNWGLKPGKYE